MGAKLVLFVTGMCHAKCFYCPLSEKKRWKDVVYANERKVRKDALKEIIEEAESIDALGTGITGGEPLLVLHRVENYISALKSHFGKEHHIHLYTAVAATPHHLKRLKEAGLDEIRFHLNFSEWYPIFSSKEKDKLSFESSILKSLEIGLDTGVEIPLLPANYQPYLRLIDYLNELGLNFLNLNELEYSPTNYHELNNRGWSVKNDISSAVKGSEILANKIFSRIEEKSHKLNLSIHFCSVSFKDGVQLRNRLIRQALNRARPYEKVTEDGTLIKGIVQFPRHFTSQDMENYLKTLQKKLDMTSALFYLNYEKKIIETSIDIIKKIAKVTNFPCFVIENYPSYDGLEVEREPI